MKKILLIMISIISLSFIDINASAKTVLKDEIEDNSYVIGKYYFTRKANEDNNYDGTLTTPEIMLAAGTIDGGLDNMIIYHKNFLGNWINGLTGEAITPPNYFEIENRNLKDILPVPNLGCRWMSESDVKFATCESGFYHLNDGPIWAREDYTYPSSYGVEYYTLKDNENNNPTANVTYTGGKFISQGKEYIPTLLVDEPYDNTQFYNIVSRFYYLDGEEKIYGEYSNISNNGTWSKLDISSVPKLNATRTDLSLYIDSVNPTEPIYYNVKFNLSDYDTSKYDIREFKVYCLADDDEDVDYSIIESLLSVPGGNDTYRELYFENAYSEKYLKFYRYGEEYSSWTSIVGDWYLVAEVSGETALPEVFNDVSDETAYSMRLVNDSSAKYYVAYITLCDKVDKYACYLARTTVAYLSAQN